MVGSIVSSQNFNPAALRASGVYTRIVPPPGYIQGLQTNVAAIIGTASWGPKNTPVSVGSPSDLGYYFGGITSDSKTDVADLCTDAMIAFQQAAEGAIHLLLVRISDGTDVAASYAVKDTTAVTPLTGLTVTAKYTGTLGNSIKIKISAGSVTGKYNVAILPFGSTSGELFVNVAGGGAGVFWTNLAAAINGGQNNVRGPSAYLTAGAPNASGIAPALGTFSLISGTDGRASVVTANYEGSDTARPKTGMYSLRNAVVSPSVFWLAGMVDEAAFPNMQALANQEGMVAILPIGDAGQTTAQAITAKQSLGIADYNVVYVKDWVYWEDPVNGGQRLLPPTPFIGGRIAALSPEQSPENKPVYGVVGTDRNSLQQGNFPYSLDEIGDLQSNGIMFITNPINAGPQWGMWHGKNSSADPVTAPVEYARMTNFLAKSITKALGKFIGELQTTNADDSLRAAIKLELDEFLQTLKDNKQITSYQTVCDRSNNSRSDIAKHYLKVDVFVEYMSSVDFLIVSLQGGTNVVTIQTQAAPLAA